MSNPHCKTPSGQSPQNDLVNTPEHFYPGYCGQPRKYDPREFGLTGNEEWRNPRMFRNMTYQTDAEAMNAMRMAQPRRPMYRPTETSIVNNLTDECLADVSAPQFEMSMPSPMSGSCGEYLDNVTPPQLCTTADSSNNNILTTTVRTITTQRDQSGKVTSRVEETSTVSNDQGANLDNTPVCCPGQGPTAGRHLQFCNMPDQSEDLANISMPPFYDNSHPAMSTRIAQRSMDQSACLENISAPSFADSNLADVSMPSGICGANGDSIRQPTQYTNECLNSVSMPSCMGSSGASRRQVTQMSQDRLEDISMPSFGNVSRVPNRQSGYMTSECLNDVSAPSFGSSPARSRVYRSQPRSMLAQSNLNSTVLDDISMPSFEGSSCATARSMQQRSMKSQNICDTSAPSYVSYGQGPNSGECLENISMPMYGYSGRSQMTNECLEEVTMPSFECTTNNQFIEDISMPTFGGVSYASQGRTPTRQQYSMPAQSTCCSMEPCFQNDQQEYLDQVTMPSFGNSTRGPMPSECLTDISMPSFGGVSGASRGRTPSRQQRSMAAQNMCNISGPIYESSRVGQMTNECLDDVTQPSYGNSGREVSYSQFLEEMSMPSFGGVSGASRPRTPTRQQQQSMTSQNICDISAPSFAGSGRGTISNEYSGKEVCYSPCLEEESMPSFGGVSGVSRPRTPTRQQQQSMASQNICDVSAPSFASSGRQQQSMPSQNICDVSAPSFASSGRQQQSMPSQNICDVSAPSFASSGRQQQSMPSQNICDVSAPSFASSGCQQQSMPSQNICDVSAPSFASSGRQQQSMPSQNICDVSAPSFASSGCQQQSMPSQNICDVSAPSFASSGCQQQSMPSQNICDVSAPSFASSGCQQQSMPSQNICDVSAPSFASSGRQQQSTPSQNICDVSAPSFASSGCQQQSMPSQNICDVSAPSFASSGRGTMNSECCGQEVSYSQFLEDMSMPSFGGVSGASRPRTPTRQQQQSMPSQNICDVSAPSFASSGRQQQSMASQNICDISAPSFNSSGRRASNSECLENVTMPSGVAVSTSSRRQRTSIAECLDNVSAPSFAHSTLRSRSPQRRQRSRQNDSGEKCQTTTTTSEIIDEISMPTCGDVSGSSRAKTPIRQKRSITTKTVCKSSTPASRNRGPMNSTAECIAARGQTPKRRQQTMTSQKICDISAPSLESCGTGGLTNECLNDISMPSYGASLECSRPNTCASECLNDVSAPSFAQSISRGSSQRQQMALSNACKSGTGDMSNGYIMDVSMPSFGGISGASRQRTLNQQQQQCSMPSQNICDISPVSYASSGRGNTMTNECLYDVSMPSFADVSGSSQRQQTMPSECLNDVSAPSFTRTMSPQVTQRSIQNRSDQCRLQDMSMPSFADVSGVSRARTLSRQQRSMRGSPGTRECLEDVSMPSFGVSGVSCARCPTMQSQQICDISAPSYNSSGFATMTSKSMGRSQSQGPNSRVQQSPIMNNSCRVQSECLQNVTMPSFGNISTVSTSSRRDLPMTSECLSNVTPPSFGRSGNTQELWNISAPVFESSANLRKPRSEPSYECDALEDESAPSFGFNSQAMKSIYQIPTANSSNSVYSGTAARQVRSFPCISQQNIGDISAPSMVSSRVDCCYGQLDSSGQPYPTEYPGSKSRSQSKQSSRYTNCNLDCEGIENITEPSMLANSTMYGQMATEQSQCLADVSAPSGMESQFSTLCSKLTTEESYPSEMLHDVSAPSYANSISRSQSKQTTRVTTCTLNCENIENITEPSILTNSSKFGKIVSERLREASQHLADVSAPSGMNSHYSNVESNIMDVSEPCEMFCSDVCAEEGNASERRQLDKSDPRATNSSRSMKRGEGSALTGQRNNQDEQSPTDCPCPSTVDVEAKKSSTSGQGVAGAQDSKKRDSNAGKKSIQSINDISMPEFESTPISQSPRESNRKNSTAISDITEPSFGPSLQSTNKTQDTTGSYHGFDSMDNYAPFDELINSRPENCEPPTPQPVRSKPNDCPATPKSRPKTPQKGHCTCGVNGNTRSSAKQRSRNTNR
ncbi:mucin-5AC isoform X2 [Drosophila mojavensis]|uniref:mucin-5AC isoform X2 n=1 Tax=Drosophila mojavensis TaxID=7230 RepID=UPI001CD12104|nr:mucin-5AC isoform X2 [Drosophila mojavensis]